MEMSKDIKVFLNYRRLKHLKRCNNFPVLISEDVAQHSYFVTIIAMILADEYNTWVSDLMDFQKAKIPAKDRVYHPFVNTDIMLRKALLHDVEEAFTSDIPWNIKHMSSKTHEVISQATAQKMNEVYEGCKTMELYCSLNKRCKERLEGQIVEVADTLELALYSFEEIQMGNKSMKSMLSKCLGIIQGYSAYNVLKDASPFFVTLLTILNEPDTILEDTLDIN